MSSYTTHKSPHVTYIPTLTGGIGADELQEFYSQYFGNPKSLKLTLLSRTIGADRIVDEIHVRFKHTQEMPWILPGVPATQKRVQILVVSIVTMRGGKLYHEHVYWDQASVLYQIGALDPDVVPEAARKLGIEKLPIVGSAAASRVLKGWDPEEEGEADNDLIAGWHDGDDGGDGDGGVNDQPQKSEEADGKGVKKPEEKVVKTPEEKVTKQPEEKVNKKPEEKVAKKPEEKVVKRPEEKGGKGPEEKDGKGPEEGQGS